MLSVSTSLSWGTFVETPSSPLSPPLRELLEPSLVMDIIPGDYVEITPSYFTRTQTCNSAAFSRINEHVDYFAVPYRLLWRWWSLDKDTPRKTHGNT